MDNGNIQKKKEIDEIFAEYNASRTTWKEKRLKELRNYLKKM